MTKKKRQQNTVDQAPGAQLCAKRDLHMCKETHTCEKRPKHVKMPTKHR